MDSFLIAVFVCFTTCGCYCCWYPRCCFKRLRQAQADDAPLSPASAARERSQAHTAVSPHSRPHYFDGVATSRSVCLLLAGSLFGLMAFSFALFLGVFVREDVGLGINGLPYPSGQPYFAETVSEMVHDPESPSGKAFFAFCLTGSICILVSWYPWHLRNVYVGDDIWGWHGFKGLFLNLRSLCPPIGMILVACIRVTPKMQRTLGDKITANIHTAGAVAAIGGFCGLEFLTLFLYHEGVRGRGKGAILQEGERLVRMVLNGCTAISIVVFQIAGILSGRNYGSGDVWSIPSKDDIASAVFEGQLDVAVEDSRLQNLHLPGLQDTATGFDLAVKKCEFYGEVFAGMFMIISHIAIWYFCKERHVNLDETIPDVEMLEERC